MAERDWPVMGLRHLLHFGLAIVDFKVEVEDDAEEVEDGLELLVMLLVDIEAEVRDDAGGVEDGLELLVMRSPKERILVNMFAVFEEIFAYVPSEILVEDALGCVGDDEFLVMTGLEEVYPVRTAEEFDNPPYMLLLSLLLVDLLFFLSDAGEELKMLSSVKNADSWELLFVVFLILDEPLRLDNLIASSICI